MPYRDFDEFFSEANKETLKFKLRGKEYEIPAQLSAKALLEATRASKAKQDSQGVEDVLGAFKAVFPKDVWDELIESGVTLDELQQLYVWIVSRGKTEEGNPTPLPQKKGKNK